MSGFVLADEGFGVARSELNTIFVEQVATEVGFLGVQGGFLWVYLQSNLFPDFEKMVNGIS